MDGFEYKAGFKKPNGFLPIARRSPLIYRDIVRMYNANFFEGELGVIPY